MNKVIQGIADNVETDPRNLTLLDSPSWLARVSNSALSLLASALLKTASQPEEGSSLTVDFPSGRRG
jgi:hypothetical protein